MIPAIGREASEPSAPERSRLGVVLVVDEWVHVRRQIVEALGRLGIDPGSVLQATTTDDARELFRAHVPEVVITDFVGVHTDDGKIRLAWTTRWGPLPAAHDDERQRERSGHEPDARKRHVVGRSRVVLGGDLIAAAAVLARAVLEAARSARGTSRTSVGRSMQDLGRSELRRIICPGVPGSRPRSARFR